MAIFFHPRLSLSLRVDDTVPPPPNLREEERERENRRKGTRDGYVDDDYDYVPEERWRREREREGGGWNWKERERRERVDYSSAMGFERRGERDVLDSMLSLNHEKNLEKSESQG